MCGCGGLVLCLCLWDTVVHVMTASQAHTELAALFLRQVQVPCVRTVSSLLTFVCARRTPARHAKLSLFAPVLASASQVASSNTTHKLPTNSTAIT